MKSLPLFRIGQLSCRYKSGPVVLKLEQLDIYRGELLFVLGKSGIGKSTLIETLGLMNKTIMKEDNSMIHFYPDSSSDKYIELTNLWDKSDDEISAFRNDYFSFVFQNTNLMPNFTSGENMCISQLIQGKSFKEAKEKVMLSMKNLDLPHDIFDKKITQLSGGQRQRLAFVRAVTSAFEVLFGDEPTGNLDKDTSYKLMTSFKKQLKKENKTGIIVSHDIDLALNFADRMLLLTINEKNGYGEVLNENIMSKNNNAWKIGDEMITNPREKIVEALGLEAFVQ